jgi:YbbR domain-containing protein
MTNFLQNLILRDFWLKLFSFVLASLVWFIVNIAIKKDISPTNLSLVATDQVVLHDLPIIVLSTAQDVPSFTVTPQSAMVTLQGDTAALRNVHRQDIRLLVDLTDKGTIKETRRRIEVSTPAGIARVKVDPEEVQLVPIPKN